MKDYDEESKFWKNLLDNGEIDEETYKSEISKLDQNINSKSTTKYNVSKIIKSCLPALIPIIILVIMIIINSGKSLGDVPPGKVERK